MTIRAAHNSTYPKLAVQWLNEALPAVLLRGVLRIKFSAGRQFSATKSPTSFSCQPLWASLEDTSLHMKLTTTTYYREYI